MVKLPGYQIFEKIRMNQKGGGGLLTAIETVYNPILIDVDNDVEILIVEVMLTVGKLRIINAYGPQEHAANDDKKLSWNCLNEEVKKAMEESCMIALEFDANAKVGSNAIKGDPNETSVTGKHLLEFLEKHDLVMANAHTACKGIIT